MSNRILLSSFGEEPNSSFGGPRKVFQLMSSVYQPLESKCDIDVLTNKGIFNLDYYHHSENAMYKGKKQLNKRTLHVKKFLPDEFKLLIKFFQFRRKIKINENIIKNYNIIHSCHSVNGASFIKVLHPSPKTIVTYHSKGSLLMDFANLKLSKDYGVGKFIYENERYEMRKCDILTFPSIGAMKLMNEDHDGLIEKELQNKTRIIYNGVDMDSINQIYKNKKYQNDYHPYLRLINIAAHVPQKNLKTLINVVYEMKKEGINVIVNQFGDGPDFNKTKHYVQELGLENNFILHGVVDNKKVMEYLVNSDVFVLTSENVVFDIVVLEAMAMQIPIIVSNDGGNLEIVNDGQNGFLCKVKDEKDIFQKIKIFINNIELRRKFAINGRLTIEQNFSAKKMLHSYEQLYRFLVEDNN